MSDGREAVRLHGRHKDLDGNRIGHASIFD